MDDSCASRLSELQNRENPEFQNTPGKSSSEGPPSPPSECRLTGKVSPRGPPNSPDGVPLRVIEFFSGIGGLRLGLEAALRTLTQGDSSLHPVEFVAAYDISTTANAVYAHNFSALPKCVSVEHLALQQVDGKADLWLLSPPCQPYTRGGKGLDSRDGRAVGLLHLLQLLRQCTSPPRFLFLENVPGFESSVCCAELQQTLAMQHYTLEQFLLSPTQIGFPNTRVRFYCLARRGAAPLSEPMQQDFMEPSRQPEWRQREGPLATEYTADFGPVGALPFVSLEVPPIANGAPRSSLALPIKEFLEEDIPEDEKPQLEVPPWRLARFREPTDGEESSGTEAARQENAGKDDGKGGPQKVENAVDRKAYSDAADKSFQAKREAQTEARNGEEQDQGRNGFRLELVTPSCTVCGTFTKGYGQNLHRGGPLLLIRSHLQQSADADAAAAEMSTPAAPTTAASSVAAAAASTPPTGEAVATDLSASTPNSTRFRRLLPEDSVRFFSSRELLRLHGFPETFGFPKVLSFRKRAALVGNSVNVEVVAVLLQHLLQH
ncbi:tRNA (cytosine(38)-C(5))-methyltransferase-like, partial [Cyclospora cayetanensis]|uniref:tRNA (Cytosine(38)-C(5))-methyltransferase-like n=1 Tax=Cyclospora cayetanensis TaxID=88456 RepID=A0A6P6S444_9EIME